MKLYFKFVFAIFVLINYAWFIPLLVSGSTEAIVFAFILVAILPCIFYLIFKEKKIEKNTDSNFGA